MTAGDIATDVKSVFLGNFAPATPASSAIRKQYPRQVFRGLISVLHRRHTHNTAKTRFLEIVMHEDLRQLIDRVEAFDIDPGEKILGYAARLARENRWSIEHAHKVVREYKRFCVLAMASGHHVTPSEAVDQAWHLHLTYTRSYWERFCGETLGRPLHHEPTSGGSSEGVKFHDWYSETLKSYERLFGEKPPTDIWPDSASRFRRAGQWAWINTGSYWLVPQFYALPIIAGVLLLLFSVLPGCVPAIAVSSQTEWILPVIVGDIFPFTLGGSGFLLFYGLLCSVGLGAVVAIRIAGKPEAVQPSSISSRELSVDEIAVLSGGASRLAYVSLTRLFTENLIEATKPGWFTRAKLIAKPCTQAIESSLDRDLYAEIHKGTPTNQLIKSIKPHYERINDKLVGMGFRDETTFHSKSALLIIGVIFLVGFLRLFQGFWVGQEIGLLLLMTPLFLIIGLLINNRNTKVTAAGESYLNRCKSTITTDQPVVQPEPTPESNKAFVLMNVALLGTTAIEGFAGFGSFTPVLRDINSSSSGGGCGGGCGSGCGGGGCGGCGG